MKSTRLRLWGALSCSVVTFLLPACSTLTPTPTPAPEVSVLPQPVPSPESAVVTEQLLYEPASRRGNPETYEVFGKTYRVMGSSAGYRETGVASWYGAKFHGRSTSSGETYDMYAISAAHKSLPIPTYARVTRLDNGRSVVVKVNDRGPFAHDRIIDLSQGAAAALDMIKDGTVKVEVVALEPYQYLAGRAPAPIPTQPAPTTVAIAAPTTVTLIATSEPAPTPSRVQQSESNYLQVGAFSTLTRAESLRTFLHPRLDHAVAVHSGEDVHRVRVGPLADIEQIKNLQLQLAAIGIIDSHLVR